MEKCRRGCGKLISGERDREVEIVKSGKIAPFCHLKQNAESAKYGKRCRLSFDLGLHRLYRTCCGKAVHLTSSPNVPFFESAIARTLIIRSINNSIIDKSMQVNIANYPRLRDFVTDHMTSDALLSRSIALQL